MSKKRGLSLEEKRTKMLELLYEKELERIAPKEKGITSMSVKEVVQSLVDDNMIDTDKIGTSVYFWAFPSKAVVVRKNQISKLKSDIKEVSNRINNSNKQLQDVQLGKDDSEERTTLLDKYDKLLTRQKELKQELEKFHDCNPKIIEEIQGHSSELIDAANRWTDNIFSICSYCKNKMFVEQKQLETFFGIPEDLDYV